MNHMRDETLLSGFALRFDIDVARTHFVYDRNPQRAASSVASWPAAVAIMAHTAGFDAGWTWRRRKKKTKKNKIAVRRASHVEIRGQNRTGFEQGSEGELGATVTSGAALRVLLLLCIIICGSGSPYT